MIWICPKTINGLFPGTFPIPPHDLLGGGNNKSSYAYIQYVKHFITTSFIFYIYENYASLHLFTYIFFYAV